MSQISVARSFHIFKTAGVPGVVQTGAGTVNSDPFEVLADRTASIIGKITKTGGTLASTIKIQVSNATEDEVKRSGFTEQWEDEASLTAQVIGDATTSFVFKITKAIFRRYRVVSVQTGGNSSIEARVAV